MNAAIRALPLSAIGRSGASAGAGRRGKQLRSNALPEQQQYRDEGCDVFPSCLACPLPRCRYDEPGGVRRLLNRERDHQMRTMHRDGGLSVDEIAQRFQVSRRTVFRALEPADHRASGGRRR